MHTIRPFCNADPPHLASVWQEQPPLRGLVQPMTASLFEQHLLTKPYFDRAGLLVATDGDRPLGFVHAGFGADQQGQQLDRQLGVTCQLMVRRDLRDSNLADELLQASEQYLQSQGANVLFAGAVAPRNPFYLGLYGGSESPGVLVSDQFALDVYQRNNYRSIDKVLVLQSELAGFRAPVDRSQLQMRRQMVVEPVDGAACGSWWEACNFAQFNCLAFQARAKQGGPALATAMIWEMEPLASGWGVRAAGLCKVEVEPEFRRQGLGTFFVSEILRFLQAEHVGLVEVQVMQENAAALGLCKKLKFAEVDQGLVLRKG